MSITEPNKTSIRVQVFPKMLPLNVRFRKGPQFSLTRNLSCDSIIHVEIEETCPVARTGRDREGQGTISISKNYVPSLFKSLMSKGSQNEHLCR